MFEITEVENILSDTLNSMCPN